MRLGKQRFNHSDRQSFRLSFSSEESTRFDVTFIVSVNPVNVTTGVTTNHIDINESLRHTLDFVSLSQRRYVNPILSHTVVQSLKIPTKSQNGTSYDCQLHFDVIGIFPTCQYVILYNPHYLGLSPLYLTNHLLNLMFSVHTKGLGNLFSLTTNDKYRRLTKRYSTQMDTCNYLQVE